MTRDGAAFTLSPTALFLGVGIVSLDLTRMLGSIAALSFVLCCVAVLIMRPHRLIADFNASFWLWALVGWCVLSTLWSAAPGLTLRYGIQLGLTFLLGILVAQRISMTSTLRVLLVTGLLTGVLCILFNRIGGNGAWAGIFGSKNALAQFATINVLAGLAVLLDANTSRMWRASALAVLALGGLLLVNADSVGALVATSGAAIIVYIAALLHFTRPLMRILLVSLAVLVICGAIFAVITGFEAFSMFVLDLTGKDVTLTGRTVLWGIAFDEIAKNPLLGQGYKGFWVPGNSVAEELWLEFGIATKQGFHFHNTLISNAVEIGLIGVAIQVGLFGRACYAITRETILRPSAETLFFIGLMARQLILTQSEVVFFSQFDPVTLITVMAIVYASRMAKSHSLAQADFLAYPSHPVARKIEGTSI